METDGRPAKSTIVNVLICDPVPPHVGEEAKRKKKKKGKQSTPIDSPHQYRLVSGVSPSDGRKGKRKGKKAHSVPKVERKVKRRRKEDKTKQEKKEKGEAKDSLFQREGDRSRTPSLERHSEKQIGPRHRSYQEVKKFAEETQIQRSSGFLSSQIGTCDAKRCRSSSPVFEKEACDILPLLANHPERLPSLPGPSQDDPWTTEHSFDSYDVDDDDDQEDVESPDPPPNFEEKHTIQKKVKLTGMDSQEKRDLQKGTSPITPEKGLLVQQKKRKKKSKKVFNSNKRFVSDPTNTIIEPQPPITNSLTFSPPLRGPNDPPTDSTNRQWMNFFSLGKRSSTTSPPLLVDSPSPPPPNPRTPSPPPFRTNCSSSSSKSTQTAQRRTSSPSSASRIPQSVSPRTDEVPFEGVPSFSGHVSSHLLNTIPLDLGLPVSPLSAFNMPPPRSPSPPVSPVTSGKIVPAPYSMPVLSSSQAVPIPPRSSVSQIQKKRKSNLLNRIRKDKDDGDSTGGESKFSPSQTRRGEAAIRSPRSILRKKRIERAETSPITTEELGISPDSLFSHDGILSSPSTPIGSPPSPSPSFNSFSSPSSPSPFPNMPAQSSPRSFLPQSPSASGALNRFFGLGTNENVAVRVRRVNQFDEVKFMRNDYESIIQSLVKLSLVERKEFFIASELFQIDPDQLLQTIEKIIFSSSGEFQQEGKVGMEGDVFKEEIIKTVIIWRKTLGSHYRCFFPSLASQIENFLDSLGPNLSHLLVWKDMNLTICGSASLVSHVMTYFMFRTFQNVRPSEFLEGAWEKEDKYVRAPNLMEMVDMFNRLSSMVVESILFCDESSRRHILAYMIKLAKKFLKINNFEGVAAVMSGLNRSSIRRLKPLWGDLSQKFKRIFEVLDEMLVPELNFKGYRTSLQAVEFGPVVPWLGPKLRELRFLYEVPITSEDGSVNFPHMMKIGASIRCLLEYQKADYDAPFCDKTLLLQYLRYRSIPEEVCYQRSLELHPIPKKKMNQE